MITTRDTADNIAFDSSQSPLTALPSETIFGIVAMVATQDTIKTMGTLSRTCRQFNSLFKRDLDNCRLLQHVLRGNQDVAKKMLEVDPQLLYLKATAKDYSGRTIAGSPFQAALGAGDIWMLNMMKAFIDQTHTHETALAQYQEQFAEADNRKTVILAQLEEDLKAVVAAISVDPCTAGEFGGAPTLPGTKKAIKQYQDNLDLTSKEIIQSGEHFPLEMLGKIYDVYNANWNRWTSKQLSCYSVDVIGYLLRFAPAVDAQRFVVGLQKTVSEKDVLPRSFDCADGRKYFPLNVDPRFVLGRSHFIDCYDGVICGGWVVGMWARPRARERLHTYVKQKHDILENLNSSLRSTLRHKV